MAYDISEDEALMVLFDNAEKAGERNQDPAGLFYNFSVDDGRLQENRHQRIFRFFGRTLMVRMEQL